MKTFQRLFPLSITAVLVTACTVGGGEDTAVSSAPTSTNAAASSSAAAASSSAAAGAIDVPVVPGYAPGTFPEVPAITLPDVSLLTDAAPSFAADMQQALEDLPGFTVSSARCGADGSLSTSSINSSLYSDGATEIVNNGDGSGWMEDGSVEIVNNGDGSGWYQDGTLEITVNGDGSGWYKDGTLEIVANGDGSGWLEEGNLEIVNNGNGSGWKEDGTVEIVNNGDGSGWYQDGAFEIINYGDGSALIKNPTTQAKVEAEPLKPLAPIGSFPSLEALAPQNICGVLVTLDSEVLFDFDKSDIRPDAQSVLSTVATSLNQANPPAVEVIGHTDSVGDEAYNQSLSERRAAAVVAELEANGVTAQLTATGQGELAPIAPNENADGSDNPSGRQLNRRVEIFIPSFAQ